MDRFVLAMPAKINLGLDVVSRRKDGYHEVRMVMQSVALFDEISIEKTNAPGIVIQTDMPRLPLGRRNLAYRAAELFFERYGISAGISVFIRKRIPLAAGLAGGSADAAAVLAGLNRLFGVHAGKEALLDLGVLLGADVPFCLQRGTALAEGIGEEITALSPIPECAILLIKPPYSVFTKDVYEAFDAQPEAAHPPLDKLLCAIREQNLQALALSMGNSLEEVVLQKHSDIKDILCWLTENGALGAGMSGSGPSVFGIYADKNKAAQAMDAVRSRFPVCQHILTKPYWPDAVDTDVF